MQVVRQANSALCGLVAWTLILFMGTSVRAEVYSLTDLGSLSNHWSLPIDINDAGQIVGIYQTDTEQRGFLYSNGTMTDLGSFGGNEVIVGGINAAGQVVGGSRAGEDKGNAVRAFLYSNGTMIDLGTLGGVTSQAYGINTAGQIVGQADVDDSSHSNTFLYSNGTMISLGTLGARNSQAWSINDAGQIVGRAAITNDIIHPFLFSNGTLTDLGSLGGSGTALDINSSGQVVGYSCLTNTSPCTIAPFLYDNGLMKNLGSLGGTAGGEATGINDAGQIVGNSTTSRNQVRAFIYNKGVMMDLNSMMDATGVGWLLNTARAINNNGQIVGQGTGPNGLSHAILLTPVSVCCFSGFQINRQTYSIVISGLTYNRQTQMFNGTIKITNIGGAFIPGPLQIELQDLTPGVTLVNATGMDKLSGKSYPYITTAPNGLAAGASVTVPVQFNNPTRATINYTVQVYRGSF